MPYTIKLRYVRGRGVYNACRLELSYSTTCLDRSIPLSKTNGIYAHHETIT